MKGLEIFSLLRICILGVVIISVVNDLLGRFKCCLGWSRLGLKRIYGFLFT